MSKNSVRTLIESSLLLKNANHRLSFLQVVIFLPMEGFCLDVDGC
jgi:prophage maintenance system killer protein